jgi:putative NADPH-quinone reductase
MLSVMRHYSPTEPHVGRARRKDEEFMNTLIVYCHPHDSSHNRHVLDAVKRGLEAAGTEYELIDLYRCGFDPMLKPVEYERMFVTPAGDVEDDVRKYQAMISNARNLVFIYPVWWYSMPAAMKGFVDRVFTRKFAYQFRPYSAWLAVAAAVVSFIPGLRYAVQPHVVKGLLGGKRAVIFRTYGGLKAGRRIFGNTQTSLENVVLRFCGITDIVVRELYDVNLPTHTPEDEKAHLREVELAAAAIRNV